MYKQYLKFIWFYAGCSGRTQAGAAEEKRWDRKIEERNNSTRCGIKGQCSLIRVLGHDLCEKGWYIWGIILCLYKNIYCTCTMIKNAEKQIEKKYTYFLKIISGIRECRYNE